jgi:hypothetical protein
VIYVPGLQSIRSRHALNDTGRRALRPSGWPYSMKRAERLLREDFPHIDAYQALVCLQDFS